MSPENSTEHSPQPKLSEAEPTEPTEPSLPAPTDITLSLVSHTNVGKTSLARTLLRRDVGQVLDQAHVTDQAEIFELIQLDSGSRLLLADTPGFGDSARLLQRLRRSDRPVWWFLQQTWDRYTDRPFWCSQQATLNVREQADLVLYLVNATEEPDEAGYVDHELALLDWLDVPVWILLNHTGDTSFQNQPLTPRIERWRDHTRRFQVVRGVGALDAYNRCWVEEDHLLRDLEPLLPEPSRPLMHELRQAWNRRNLDVMDRCVEAIAGYLAGAALDRESLASRRPSRAEKDAAMAALGRRAVDGSEDLMSELLARHQLEGTVAAEIDKQLDAFSVEGEDALDTERGALLGGVVSGAVGGLAADLLAGGLTFGGGMLAGAILGAVGGAGLARGYRLVKGDKMPSVAWSQTFLDSLAAQALLRYLAVAHFGRGRGEFRDHEASRRWLDAVTAELKARHPEWQEMWQSLATHRANLNAQQAARRLRPLVHETVRAVLLKGYPGAKELLGSAEISKI